MTAFSRRAVGIALVVLALGGLVRSTRAFLSHAGYHRLRYGRSPELDVNEVARACERLFRLYPYSHYLCIFVAERACFGPGGQRIDALDDRRAAIGGQWCDRGLKINPHSRRLRYIKTRLLERDSAKKALAYWLSFVDWQYWDPSNHAVLAELYAKTGEFVRAAQALEMARNSPRHAAAARTVQDAWRREMLGPGDMPQRLPPR